MAVFHTEETYPNSKTLYIKLEPRHHKESSRTNLMNLVQIRFLLECFDDKNLMFCNSSFFLFSGKFDAITKLILSVV